MAKSEVSDLADQVEQKARASEEREVSESGAHLLSSGVTTLNLAATGSAIGAFATEKIYNIVGDKATTKTALCLGTVAEATRDSFFDDYDIILDEPERSNEFDIGRLYGSELAKRLKAPRYTKSREPIYSRTVQQFYDNLSDYLLKKRKCIYILDSLDALTTLEEQAFELKQKAQRRKQEAKALGEEPSESNEDDDAGKKTSGTYGMEKAKYISKLLRMIQADLADTGSILIIISQVRDDVNPASFTKQSRSGGKALDFYCAGIFWTMNLGKIKRTVGGNAYTIGTRIRVDVTKNKLNGRLRTSEYPIYYDYGIDDIGSCVNYLIDTEAWECSDGKLTKMGALNDLMPEPKKGKVATMTIDAAIKAIEASGSEKDLRMEVVRTWHQIEEKLRLGRKPKYA